MKRLLSLLIAVVLCSYATVAFAQYSTVATFDGGSNDGFDGNAFFEATGGNPGGNAHHLVENFFSVLDTGFPNGPPPNLAFLGDYSSFDEVTLLFDIQVTSLTLSDGITPISKPIGFSFIDRDIQGPTGSSGVYFRFPDISEANHSEWTTLGVTIADPTSTTLPPGWIGFGDIDPNTLQPILPPGATFATVMASVDEFGVNGQVPGLTHGLAIYDVRIDNITVVVPEPGTSVLLLIIGLTAIARRCRPRILR